MNAETLTGSASPSGTLPRLLRGSGAAVIVAALSLFLFQQWGNGDDIHRYLLLLGQTLVLAASGFACVRWLQETKGARTFLALAVAAVPVNFAILGALLHSRWIGQAVDLPAALAWQAADSSTLMIAAGISLPLLAAISRFGFMVLARRSALPLSLMFLAVNGALLLPSRDSSIIGWLVVGSLGLLLLGLRRLRHDATLRTLEGRVARTVLFAAPAILVGRNLWLHSFGDFLFLAMAGGLFLLLRMVAGELPANRWRKGLEAARVVPAAMVGLGAGELVSAVTQNPALITSAGCLAAALLVMEISRWAAGGVAGYRLLGTVIAVGSALANLTCFGGQITGLIALATGIGCVIYGYNVRQLSVLVLGAIAALGGLGYQTTELVHYFDLGGWSALATLGIAAVGAGSLLERHGDWLRGRGAVLRSRFSQWEA